MKKNSFFMVLLFMEILTAGILFSLQLCADVVFHSTAEGSIVVDDSPEARKLLLAKLRSDFFRISPPVEGQNSNALDRVAVLKCVEFFENDSPTFAPSFFRLQRFVVRNPSVVGSDLGTSSSKELLSSLAGSISTVNQKAKGVFTVIDYFGEAPKATENKPLQNSRIEAALKPFGDAYVVRREIHTMQLELNSNLAAPHVYTSYGLCYVH